MNPTACFLHALTLTLAVFGVQGCSRAPESGPPAASVVASPGPALSSPAPSRQDPGLTVVLRDPPASVPAGRVVLAYPTALAVDGEGRVLVTTGSGVNLASLERAHVHDTDYVQALLWDRSSERVEVLARTSGGTQTSADSEPGPIYGLVFPWSYLAPLSIHDVLPDASGGYYLADSDANTVYRLDGSSRRASILVHRTGQVYADPVRFGGFSGDGGPAAEAELHRPWALAMAGGRLYIADRWNHAVRAIDLATGSIETVLGTGTAGRGQAGGTAGRAPGRFALDEPMGLAAGPGGVYVSDTGNHRVLRLAGPGGPVEVVAGAAEPATSSDQAAEGLGGPGQSGPGAGVRLCWPTALELAPDGTLYIADTLDHRVLALDSRGRVRLVAGNGRQGYAGDGGLATEARLNLPQGLALTALRRGPGAPGAEGAELLIADTYNHRVRSVDLTTGRIRTVLGTGSPVPPPTAEHAGLYDREPRLAAGAGGEVYLSERGGRMRILRLDPATGELQHYAGGGNRRLDDVAATLSHLKKCSGLDLSPDGALVLADTEHCRVCRVDPATGLLHTMAGLREAVQQQGVLAHYARDAGDGGPARDAALGDVHDVVVGPDGVAYIVADNRVRAVDPVTGLIHLVVDFSVRITDGHLNLLALAPGGVLYVEENGHLWRLHPPAFEPEVVPAGGRDPQRDGRVWGMAADSRGNLLYTDQHWGGSLRLFHAATGKLADLLASGDAGVVPGLEALGRDVRFPGGAQWWFGEVDVDAQDRVYVVAKPGGPMDHYGTYVLRFQLTEELISRALERTRQIAAEGERAQVEQAQQQVEQASLRERYEPTCQDALTALREGRYSEAEWLFTQAVDLLPEDPRAWIGRAMARLKVPDLPGAISDLDRAAALSNNDPAVLRLRGHARQAAGDLPGAVADWKAALAADPSLEPELGPLIQEAERR